MSDPLDLRYSEDDMETSWEIGRQAGMMEAYELVVRSPYPLKFAEEQLQELRSPRKNQK